MSTTASAPSPTRSACRCGSGRTTRTTGRSGRTASRRSTGCVGGLRDRLTAQNYASVVADANEPNGTIVLTHETSEAITQRFIANYPSVAAAFTNGVLSAHIANDVTRPYAETNFTYPNYAAYQGGARASFTAVTNRNAQLTLISADAPLRDVAVSSSSAPAPASTVAASASAASSAPSAGASAAAASSAPTATGITPTARNAIIGGAAGGAALLIALFVSVVNRTSTLIPQDLAPVQPSQRQGHAAAIDGRQAPRPARHLLAATRVPGEAGEAPAQPPRLASAAAGRRAGPGCHLCVATS